MIKLKKILVPVDLFAPSRPAIDYALSLALRFQADLELANIVPSLAAFNYPSLTDAYDLEKQALAESKSRLPALVPAEYHSVVHLQTVVRVGDVREELLAIVKDDNIDLVVMGTHGRGSIGHFFLGSTTESILRRVTVPVLTVSHLHEEHEARSPAGAAIHRIVYATDLSPRSELGLSYASVLANKFDAELILLHVMDTFEGGHGGAEVMDLPPLDRGLLRTHAMAALENLLKASRSPGHHTQTVVIEGTPHRAIASFAEEANADLIVLNLQSKGFLERAMLGATAERVVRSATVPVLSLPLGTAELFMRDSAA
jgi:nucleotide-binding universal stress UspA family protein